MFPFQMRTWILDPHAQESVDAAAADHPRIEEEMRGVEWNLIRSPEDGQQVGPDVYLYVNQKSTHKASLITVLYTYNDDEVNVLRIWIR